MIFTFFYNIINFKSELNMLEDAIYRRIHFVNYLPSLQINFAKSIFPKIRYPWQIFSILFKSKQIFFNPFLEDFIFQWPVFKSFHFLNVVIVKLAFRHRHLLQWNRLRPWYCCTETWALQARGICRRHLTSL